MFIKKLIGFLECFATPERFDCQSCGAVISMFSPPKNCPNCNATEENIRKRNKVHPIQKRYAD
ncbi:MAG: hypothetical protein US25_C0020G0006 [Candidatus Moranbacteria bacterium GW2011_GWE1_36_7]|nr:MAG: hypothetical protein UR99_C0038G0009 [Candidatus Moranbacteria bacterium GW2011_GWD2_36_12]KKQ06738.1 MAG: hypothetical protein US16_C0010G0022 [Candidatus Moranbacteria bacterium GW2011_GWE2_36_40]KKQ14766.1 MAG: hypothetical protein US25_C0020G0006 [Candidatus Moranbacteria bacterium GW2011_GWE1_36_7]